MANRQDILNWCNTNLRTEQFKDYAPNGLQVEGADDIHTIVTAVTASYAAIEFAVQQGAQMLLVHHGMFWKSELATITGWKRERIALLLKNNVNLVGYHCHWMHTHNGAIMSNWLNNAVGNLKAHLANKI